MDQTHSYLSDIPTGNCGFFILRYKWFYYGSLSQPYMKNILIFPALSLMLMLGGLVERATAEPVWPHAIPCRTQDGSNLDLFVMTLGVVQTPIAQGTFDPGADEVTFPGGTVISNYYRDVLGAKFYQPLDKTNFSRPPSGWCTWYYYFNRINAEEVCRNADWMAEHLKDYGAEVVQIDDGWQGSGGKGSARNWEAINTNNFPAGLGSVADHIKSLGLTPGLWLAPHGQNNDEVVRKNPGVFLLKPDGSTASATWEGRFLVDPSSPATQGYLEHLFRRLAGWGFEYFKIDGQPIVVDEYGKTTAFMKQPSADAAGLYRQTVASIRDAIGPKRYLLGCWGIPLEGAGIMNGSRTGGDVVLGWDGFQVALRPTLQYYYLHNIAWYCDPDVLLVRPPLTVEQARVWTTVEGLTGQALMSSDRLMDLGDARVELLRRVFPATDIRPLDLFPATAYKRIWDLKVNHLGRSYDVVGVFNFRTEAADQILLNWKDLGLPEEQPVHVFDFWNKEYLGAWAAGMAVSLPPTSCRVLTLLPDNGRIQLISTSRHITQGPVELMAFEQNGNSFQGRSRLIKNDPYQLSFVFPVGTNQAVVRAVAHAGRRRLPVVIANHQGWASVEIHPLQTREATWEVQFQPASAYHFPPSAPEHVSAGLAGLADVNLSWPEQYYLNEGYQVYLDGRVLGHASEADFVLRGLNSGSNHVAMVKAVGFDGIESKKSARIEFKVADLVPDSVALTEQNCLRASGNWDGYEVDSLLDSRSLSVAGKRGAEGVSGFAGAETVFGLNGLYQEFTAQAGVDDASEDGSQVEFIVTADGRELWRSGVMAKNEPAESVKLDVRGVRQLALRSRSPVADPGRSQTDWLEPRVYK